MYVFPLICNHISASKTRISKLSWPTYCCSYWLLACLHYLYVAFMFLLPLIEIMNGVPQVLVWSSRQPLKVKYCCIFRNIEKLTGMCPSVCKCFFHIMSVLCFCYCNSYTQRYIYKCVIPYRIYQALPVGEKYPTERRVLSKLSNSLSFTSLAAVHPQGFMNVPYKFQLTPMTNEHFVRVGTTVINQWLKREEFLDLTRSHEVIESANMIFFLFCEEIHWLKIRIWYEIVNMKKIKSVV